MDEARLDLAAAWNVLAACSGPGASRRLEAGWTARQLLRAHQRELDACACSSAIPRRLLDPVDAEHAPGIQVVDDAFKVPG